MSASKRKRNVVTMQQKLSAIGRMDKGESVRRICEELNVGRSTVHDWRNNRKSIEDFCSQIESEKTLTERRTLRKPTNDMVDGALWMWFLQERRKGTRISGPLLKEKGMSLHTQFGGNTAFSVSDGWLGRWKKRHGVSFLNICGEKMSADAPAASDFVNKLDKIISEDKLLPDQVYSLDETGLNFKSLPQKTFFGNEGSAPEFKFSKERITVVICSNASGTHKLPLLVIGKYQNPIAFKNLNISSLPVCYCAQKSTWMDSYTFKDWFVNEFDPLVRHFLKERKLPEKAVLVLDSAGRHPTDLECEDTPGIKLLFLPPNVTSIIQPMDQGVIASFKRRYRRNLVSEILGKMDNEGMDLVSALKSINFKEVIYMTARAYEDIPSSTIVRSWRKAWPNIEKKVNNTADNDFPLVFESDNNAALLNDLMKLAASSDHEIVLKDVEEWVTGVDFLTDDQIVQVVKEEHENSFEVESEEENEEEKISHQEGKRALESALLYVEQQEQSSADDVMFMKKWRDYALKKTMKNKTQKKITDFF